MPRQCQASRPATAADVTWEQGCYEMSLSAASRRNAEHSYARGAHDGCAGAGELVAGSEDVRFGQIRPSMRRLGLRADPSSSRFFHAGRSYARGSCRDGQFHDA